MVLHSFTSWYLQKGKMGLGANLQPRHRKPLIRLLLTRSIQRTQTPPRLWPLTLTCDLDLIARSRKLMSLDVAYCIVPWYQVRYDVCECNCMRDMTINSFLVTFDLHLWPSVYFKVTFTLISRCTLCSCTFVQVWSL